MYLITPKLTFIPPHIADISTPVSVYIKLRELYPSAIMLESSDYHSQNNAMSFICFDPIAEIIADDDLCSMSFPDNTKKTEKITAERNLPSLLHEFINSFNLSTQSNSTNKLPVNGFFGYTAYDSIQYFETIEIQNKPDAEYIIPLMRYTLYRNVIAFNHFTNKMYLVEFNFDDNDSSIEQKIIEILNNQSVKPSSFKMEGEETTNLSDSEYLKMVEKGIYHCYRGDVFQIVLSRQYSQQFSGDEFNVYRALRNINPSPYLFYFDYGNYKIFGSSPEAQLIIKDRIATINPIAGTFKRTGDDSCDRELAEKLSNDPKENAEHVMLVDLARNDLSRHCANVKVNIYKEVQYYSHVLHLVSKVSGELDDKSTSTQVMSSTFPAGTLSGAPKHRAMQLINEIENQPRGFYGGCIGYMGFDGSINQAIMIRSFLSKGNTLYSQAGAGVVAKSVVENELQEVKNKLGALKNAVIMAEKF